ncbi:hypothetical protein FIV42_20355 [Persicimonas caeni]|uniref:Uncharacterized protein n=1 Tax=Persicimonas caeni TaxID=2292766 RepID=A0A4Y6PXY7_PERCE|nr:HmuY family protein [Persicimonas caeni]QDG53009.1 hypothetical protein FIV42_20355 [Persicimonas caeni]QED34231.1 hypothetical protein FRD00_20350 [Persicimonas caeni]
MKYRSLFVMLICSMALVACGDDSDDANNTANNTQADAGTDAMGEDAGEEDVSTIGDVSQQNGLEDHRCGDAPIADWPLNEAVSTESITSTNADGVTTLVIEAAAGGSQASADNPFIYLDLSTGEKVEVNDVEAYSNTDWDLAFKRYIIRSNGADSGPGDVSISKMTGTTFADVTEAPTDENAWEQDVSYEDDCTPITDPIGTLVTAFNYVNPGKSSGSWYEYPGISPTDGEIYFVDVPEESKTYKLEIESWESGTYTIHVAEL